jgi:predicted SAM-dependent methyltransferase
MRYKKLIKELLPPFILRVYRKMNNFSKKTYKKGDYRCPLCKNEFDHFNRLPDYYIEMLDKYQYVHPFFYSETFNYLKYSCPACGASDRNRLYALYFEKRFSEIAIHKSAYNILDIAPDKNLSDWIKKYPFIQYRSLDLYMEGVDDKADITNLNIYEKDRFDIIICSHVLEHIVDDRKAMGEIFRVLKPNGFAIIMVPIMLTLHEDLENHEWTSEADRWKYYGQNDHVRMYSKGGFVKKLEKTGFKVLQLGIEYFGKETFLQNGIHRQSVLYIVEK